MRNTQILINALRTGGIATDGYGFYKGAPLVKRYNGGCATAELASFTRICVSGEEYNYDESASVCVIDTRTATREQVSTLLDVLVAAFDAEQALGEDANSNLLRRLRAVCEEITTVFQRKAEEVAGYSIATRAV